jgi:hypothetical protein
MLTGVQNIYPNRVDVLVIFLLKSAGTGFLVTVILSAKTMYGYLGLRCFILRTKRPITNTSTASHLICCHVRSPPSMTFIKLRRSILWSKVQPSVNTKSRKNEYCNTHSWETSQWSVLYAFNPLLSAAYIYICEHGHVWKLDANQTLPRRTRAQHKGTAKKTAGAFCRFWTQFLLALPLNALVDV